MLSGKHQITTIGSAVMDIMFKTREGLLIDNPKDLTRRKLLAFEYGAKLVSTAVSVNLGGSALNTAATFASLKLKPSVLSSIGDDAFGRDILAYLRQRHIGSQLLQIDKKRRTAFSVIIGNNSFTDHVIFYYPAARESLTLTPGVLSKIRSPWLFLGSISGSSWQSNLQNLFSFVGRKNLKLAWNPGSDELKAGHAKLKRYFHLTEVLQVNSDEAVQLLLSAGDKVKTVEPKLLIKKLHSFGQALTVITHGGRGAYVYNGKKLLYKSALKEKVVADTTGAGDAFGSGLVSGLLLFKGNLSRALALGILNSGLVVSQVGAQNGIVTPSQVRRFNI